MLSKRIFVLVFLVVFLNLMVGCDTTTPEIENLAPTIESDPVTTAKAGMEYTYDVDATDPNGDTLTYSLTTNPSGMTINSLTGLITWTPAVIGGFDVTVNVSDGILSTTQSFNISVTDRIPMEITVNLPTFKVDEPCWFTVSMVANDDLDKLVVASLEWPTSLTDGDLEGTLETDEESDLAFALTGGLFQTDPFIMGDVTANFRGTFTKVGTYSTTIVVKTYPGNVLLCEKDINIVVEAVERYSFTYTQDVNDGTVGQLVTTVTEDGDWMVWTFDFPVEEFTGDGNLNVGLIIALDGEGEGPAFQIHNNDGADSSYPWGTWLMSPWGPTINNGWFGWHSNDTNIPVTDLDWVEAIGQRNTPWKGIVSGDGVMEIRIKKSELGNAFHWAANPTVGTGFYGPASDVTMQIPAAFDWTTPLVTMSIPNYIAR